MGCPLFAVRISPRWIQQFPFSHSQTQEFTMLFVGLWTALLAVASSHARNLPRAIPGGSLFDQVRFLDCHDGLIAAYYASPPHYTGQPTRATRWNGFGDS